METAFAIASTTPSALIERNALTAAVEIANRAIQTRNSIPILGNVRLQGADNCLTITGTDLDIEIAVTVPGDTESLIDTTIQAASALKLLKAAPKASLVSLEQLDCSAKMEFDKVNYRLPCLDAADWPTMSALGENATFITLDTGTLHKALVKVAGAISTEETRYYLNGIYFHTMRDVLTMVATDGHRLYRQTIGGALDYVELPEGVIIPRATVSILAALLKGKKLGATVEIGLNRTHIEFHFAFEFGRISVRSKLIDGTFPDYQRVIPCAEDFALFNASELADAVKSVSLINSEKSRAFKLELGCNIADLSANSPDNGSAQTAIPAHWSGGALQIGFNAKYMLEAIAAHGGEEIRFGFRDAGTPCLIDDSANGWTAAIMPMRV